MRWDPFRDMSDLNRMVNRVFGGSRQEGWMPSVDVYDKGDSIQVKADLPGVDPGKVEVDIRDNILSIKGHRQEERRVEQGGYYRVEREFGDFQRSIALPQDARTEDVDASYEDGVLTISIPKAEQQQPQRVRIRSKEHGRQVEAKTPGETQTRGGRAA